MKVQLHEIYDSRFIPQEHPPGPLIDALNLSINGIAGHNPRWIGTDTVESIYAIVSLCHRGGRMENINAWYLNTHMVYL
jgi:hypothetical protein